MEDKPNEQPSENIVKGIKKVVKGTKGQTKEEQQALLQKFGAYANRD